MRRRKEVLKWLKDNSLYNKIQRRIPFSLNSYPTEENRLDELILSLFSWENSKEGFEYWNNINKQYQAWYGNTTIQDD